MGSATSGRTVTTDAATDRLNDRLGDLRDELREAIADESTALTSLRQTEIVVGRATTRVRRCSARLALWQKELGDKGIVIDELSDHELVRIDGVTHRLPLRRTEPVIGEAGAVGRLAHSIAEAAKTKRIG